MSTTQDQGLNIIFIGESYLEGMAGSRRIQNIIDSLNLMDNIIIHNLIVGNPNDKGESEMSGVLNKVRYQKVNFKKFNILSLLLFYYKSFKFIQESIKDKFRNVLFCYGSPTILNLPILIYSKYKKILIVVDIIEDNSLLSRTEITAYKKLKNTLNQKIENNIHLYSNGIFVISSSLMVKIKGIVKDKVPVSILPISVNFNWFKDGIQVTDDRIMRIFYGGSYGEKDGLVYLLKGFEKLLKSYDNLELVLTGKSNKNVAALLTDIVHDPKVRSKIVFLGYLDNKTYYETIQRCDVLCMTRVNSFYANAGFPFKLGEMLATGKPVIATKVGDVGMYLKDMENALLIEPESHEEIERSIKFLIENPPKAKEIGINGRLVASTYFNSDEITKNLFSFIMNLNKK
jgi:glycosyltransferase involved in cell wall biosynthesis